MEARLAAAQMELEKSQRRWSRGQEEWLGEVCVFVLFRLLFVREVVGFRGGFAWLEERGVVCVLGAEGKERRGKER